MTLEENVPLFIHNVQIKLQCDAASHPRRMEFSGTNLSHMINFLPFLYKSESTVYDPSVTHHSHKTVLLGVIESAL